MEQTPSATARAWQPGDVAMLTLRTGAEKPAMRVEPEDEEGWVWHLIGDEAFPGVAESGVTSVRRLLLVDPENRVIAERLARVNYDRIYQLGAFDALTPMSQKIFTDFTQAGLRSLAASDVTP